MHGQIFPKSLSTACFCELSHISMMKIYPRLYHVVFIHLNHGHGTGQELLEAQWSLSALLIRLMTCTSFETIVVGVSGLCHCAVFFRQESLPHINCLCPKGSSPVFSWTIISRLHQLVMLLISKSLLERDKNMLRLSHCIDMQKVQFFSL